MAISLGYLLTVLAAVAVVADMRARAVRGRGRGHGAVHPDPQSVPIEDLALVTAGPRRAALTALVGLYEAGAVDIPLTWRLRVAGPLPPGSTPLAASAHRLIASAGQPLVRGILRQLARGPEIRTAQARLAAAGYLPPAGQARLLRILRLVLPLAIVAAAVVLTPLADDGDGAGLVPVAMVAAAVAVITLARPVPVTLDGRRLVQAAGTRAAGYADGGVPGQRAVAVALFGPAALRRADAVLARRMGVGSRPQHARLGGRGGSSRGHTGSTDSGETAFGGFAGWFAFGGDGSHHGGWGGGHSDGGCGGGGHSGCGGGGCGGGGGGG